VAGASRVVLHPEGARASARPSPDALIVTPNPRAARAADAPFRSLEGLARERLRPLGLQPASALAQWRALRRSVREVLAPEDVDGSARAMAATLREVLRAGLPEEGKADEGVVADEAVGASPRLARVVEVARAYRSGLRARGLADPAEVLWCSAGAAGRSGADGGRGPAPPWWVLGYPRIGPAEAAFLAAAAPAGSVLELPGDADPVFEDNRAVARALGTEGWRVEGWRVEDRTGGTGAAPAPAAARRGLRFASRDAEIRYVLTEVKRLLSAGEAPDAIVLVSRDETAYGPPVQDVAWEYELPVVASYGVPLRESRVGAWTALLLDAVREGLPFEAVSRLLAHPLGGGLAPAVWEAARRTHPHGPEAWRELEPRTALFEWPRRAARGELLACLQRVWEAFGLSAPPRPDAGTPRGGDGAPGSVERAGADRRPPAVPGPAGAAPASPGPALAPADALAFQRLAVAAAGLGAPTGEPVAASAFLHDLDALLGLIGVPADAEPEAGGRRVELHTPLAVYGARYRHVFVLGAAEGVLPAPVGDDPVLDFAERRLAAARGLPLEGAVDAARREALSFRAVLWTLAGAAPGATFTMSYPEDSGIASPYFAALGFEPTGPGHKPPASPEERRRQGILEAAAGGDAADAVLAAARRARAVEQRREEAAGPDAHDGVVAEAYRLGEHVFSATQLLDLGQCPFRWLARVPLRLAEPEEAEEDVTPLLRGRLYHRVLELALRRGRDAAGAGADAVAIRERALAALEAAFAEAEEAENAVSVPAWPLRRAYHLEALRRVLAADSFLPEGAEVVALERRFPARGAEPPRWRGFPVRGIVDRIDRREGGLVLVDYKTRASRPAGVQDDAGRARLDLQLPLYLEAAAPALFPDEPVAGAQYYSLTKAEVLGEVRLGAARDAELAAFAERAREMLEGGSYPVAPDVDFQACRTCDFDLVCRKGPRIERMRSGGAFDGGDAAPDAANPGDAAPDAAPDPAPDAAPGREGNGGAGGADA